MVAVVLQVADYSDTTRETVWVLAIGSVLDAIANTIYSVFLAYERNGLIAAVVVVERLAAAAAGLTVLALGYGVVAVAATFSAASAVGLADGVGPARAAHRPPRRSVSTVGGCA